MKKRILSLIMSALLTSSLISVPSAFSDNTAEYGTVTVTVIDEETGELYNDENDNTSVSLFRTPLNFPEEGQFGGTIQIDEWNIGQSNPHVIEQAETNYSYTLNYSMMFFNTQYAVDAEKIPETTFDYLSSEPKEIKMYIKKNKLADPNADTDTSEKPDIQADKDYTFDDIRSMTTEEIEALYKAKGIKDYHVYTAKSAVSGILLEPRPYLCDDVPDDVITEIHDISEISKLLDSPCRFDIEKVKKSLGLPAELFIIGFDLMMPVGHEENGEFIMKKYCECFIQPIADDQQTRAELLADALNYIQLNPDYCGLTPNALGGADITVPSTTLKGDVNCDNEVDMADAVLIMQALANPNKYGIDGTAERHLTEQGKLNGDMNGDGLTVSDAQAIQRKLLGLDEKSSDLEALRKQLSDFFAAEKIDYTVIPKNKMPEQFADKYVFIKVNTADTSYATRYSVFLKENNIDSSLIKSIPYKIDSDTELNKIRELLYCYILENDIRASVDPTNEEEDLKNKTVMVKYADSSETCSQLEAFLEENNIDSDLVEFWSVE